MQAARHRGGRRNLEWPMVRTEGRLIWGSYNARR